MPSRAAVFSGIYPHQSGSYLNGSARWDKSPLNATESLPEAFRRSGYTTFGRGKLTHAPVPEERINKMWDNEPWGGGFGPFPPETDQVLGRFWGWTAWEGPDSDFPDVTNAEAAIEFLGAKHDKPFFLALGLWRPHTPFTAPNRFFEMYDGVDIPIPPSFKSGDLDDVPPLGRKLAEVRGERFVTNGESKTEAWREFLRAYCACTSVADWSAGRVIEALDNSSYADNTIVVFWSDNGYHCGEKKHWERTTLWAQSALTPMAMRLPKSVQPDSVSSGESCPRTVSLIDIYPSLFDYCGLEKTSHELQGRSLRPLLENSQAEWPYPALTTYGENYSSVRDERCRYIRYPDGGEELYDHDADPNEWDNLASRSELAEVKTRLAKSIPTRWAKSLGGRLG